MDKVLKSIAPTYEIGISYKVGDYCLYEGMPYICIEETSGTFDEDKWKMTYLSEMVSGKLNSNLVNTVKYTNLYHNSSGAGSTTTHSVNGVCSEDGVAIVIRFSNSTTITMTQSMLINNQSVSSDKIKSFNSADAAYKAYYLEVKKGDTVTINSTSASNITSHTILILP